MASERPIDPLEAHASSWAISAGGSRAPTKGSFPVAGRPLFLGLTLIDFFIFRLYLNCEPIGSCYFPLGSNPNHPPRLRIKVMRKGRLFQIGVTIAFPQRAGVLVLRETKQSVANKPPTGIEKSRPETAVPIRPCHPTSRKRWSDSRIRSTGAIGLPLSSGGRSHKVANPPARGPSHHREPIPKVVRRHAASITERPENDS